MFDWPGPSFFSSFPVSEQFYSICKMKLTTDVMFWFGIGSLIKKKLDMRYTFSSQGWYNICENYLFRVQSFGLRKDTLVTSPCRGFGSGFWWTPASGKGWRRGGSLWQLSHPVDGVDSQDVKPFGHDGRRSITEQHPPHVHLHHLTWREIYSF